MRTFAFLLAASALGFGGCVNGVRSGTPAAGGIAAPAATPAVPPAPAVPPPPPPKPSTPPAAPLVWRAEYYKISDG